MRVFVSWSGKKSRKVGHKLRKWLSELFPGVKVWVSSRDIGAGKRWSRALERSLDEAQFGILCLTEKNVEKPWVLFEAGALARSVRRLVPYRIDVIQKMLPGPLAQFQSVSATKKGTRRLVDALADEIYTRKGRPSNLELNYKKSWPHLKRDLDKIKKG